MSLNRTFRYLGYGSIWIAAGLSFPNFDIGFMDFGALPYPAQFVLLLSCVLIGVSFYLKAL